MGIGESTSESSETRSWECKVLPVPGVPVIRMMGNVRGWWVVIFKKIDVFVQAIISIK